MNVRTAKRIQVITTRAPGNSWLPVQTGHHCVSTNFIEFPEFFDILAGFDIFSSLNCLKE